MNVAYKSKILTATGALKNDTGILKGIVINSHTGGTLKLWDSLSGAGTVLHETITFAVGERFIDLFEETFQVGCFATIGGVANITFIYK